MCGAPAHPSGLRLRKGAANHTGNFAAPSPCRGCQPFPQYPRPQRTPSWQAAEKVGGVISLLAALADLAPHANGFEHPSGKRSIQGGRGTISQTRSLAALTASRFDPRHRTSAERLLAAGKARKRVTLACARKMIRPDPRFPRPDRLVTLACARKILTSQRDEHRSDLPKCRRLKHRCSGGRASGTVRPQTRPLRPEPRKLAALLPGASAGDADTAEALFPGARIGSRKRAAG